MSSLSAQAAHGLQDFGQRGVAVEFAPMFLRVLGEFEDHRQGGRGEPQPMVLTVRRRTVAKVDSIGLVVRRWPQCSAGLRALGHLVQDVGSLVNPAPLGGKPDDNWKPGPDDWALFAEMVRDRTNSMREPKA
jgi:hypothetical protein